jgi:hypothetical protein
MGARRRTTSFLVVTLAGILLLAQVQSGLAILGVFWWSILSWDNPTTHAFENAASLVPSYTDPTLEACDHIAAAATQPLPSHRSFEPRSRAKTAVLSSRITRSPPAA